MRGRKTKNAAPFPHPGGEPHLLREIFRAYQALLSGFASETGMPAARFALMRVLIMSDDGVGITDLARQLEVNPAAVTRQVKELESERLVKRQTDPKDGRRFYITLSPKGRKLFEGIHERSHQLERSLASELGAEEMVRAAKVLEKLRTFLDRHR